MSILIGTSGYSYEDWKGHLYPAGLKTSEMLSYYARRFPVVELNYTYYGMPRAAPMLQMTRKVPADFVFTVKAHSSMTHGEGFQPEAFAQFREAMHPLQTAGVLGCVLAQFPWGFQRSSQNEAYLKTFRDELPGMPLVVEFRSDTWVSDETYELLRSLDLGFCCVDEPRLKGLMPPVVTATSDIGYVRFHGRNAAKWWKHEHAYERYDYLYSREELTEWVTPIQRLARLTEHTYVLFNNCHESSSSTNARDLADLLQIRLPDPASPLPPAASAGQATLSFE